MGTMQLPVPLTTDELVTHGEVLTDELSRRDRMDARRKNTAGLYRKRLDGIDAKIRELGRMISSKQEMRDVETVEERDIFGGKIRIRRLDTGEVVTERDMGPDERQLSFEEKVSEAVGGQVIPMVPPAPAATSKRAKRAEREDAERDETQMMAATPEEAEELRAARLADDEVVEDEPAPADDDEGLVF